MKGTRGYSKRSRAPVGSPTMSAPARARDRFVLVEFFAFLCVCVSWMSPGFFEFHDYSVFGAQFLQRNRVGRPER